MLAHVGQGGAEGAVALLRVVHGDAEGPPVQGRVGRRPGLERDAVKRKRQQGKSVNVSRVGFEFDQGTQTDRFRLRGPNKQHKEHFPQHYYIGDVLEGISLAHDLVTALPVAVHVVHAMSKIGTSEIEDD